MHAEPKAARNSAPSKGFGADRRLRNAQQFTEVFDNRCTVGNSVFVLRAKPNNLGRARLGLVVSKKVSRKAVRRNRIKRIVRETFRTAECLAGLDVVVAARQEADQKTNLALIETLNELLPRLNKKCLR